jgi:transposase-like protein
MTKAISVSSMRYTDEFGDAAVKQVNERGVTVVETAGGIGLLKHTSKAGFSGRRRPPAGNAAPDEKSDFADVTGHQRQAKSVTS